MAAHLTRGSHFGECIRVVHKVMAQIAARNEILCFRVHPAVDDGDTGLCCVEVCERVRVAAVSSQMHVVDAPGACAHQGRAGIKHPGALLGDIQPAVFEAECAGERPVSRLSFRAQGKFQNEFVISGIVQHASRAAGVRERRFQHEHAYGF